MPLQNDGPSSHGVQKALHIQACTKYKFRVNNLTFLKQDFFCDKNYDVIFREFCKVGQKLFNNNQEMRLFF